MTGRSAVRRRSDLSDMSGYGDVPEETRKACEEVALINSSIIEGANLDNRSALDAYDSWQTLLRRLCTTRNQLGDMERH